MARLELEVGTDVLLLETGDALLLEPWGVTVVVPLATATGAGIVPTIVLEPDISVPLATINATGVVPTMVLDRMFGIPLATADVTGLVPTLSLDMIPIVPLATISAEGLEPLIIAEFFRALKAFTGRDLSQHDESGYPYTYPITYDGEVDVRDLQ